ncbi:MAG: DUF4854 domain-containing protein [Acetatifactor sp.]|nr:DUF4854 domain-containing protein [Acetatifactor sp.]
MKKRIFALLTAIIMVFALTACGGSKPTLENVLASDEWQKELKGWNDLVASMDITIDTVADGNTLVFEYHLPDQEVFNAFGDDECSQMTDGFLGQLQTIDFFAVFKSGYGVSLDAVRCAVFKADGTELYRDEIKK